MTWTCDCHDGRFNCEQRVRCFLGVKGALRTLIKKVEPLVSECGNPDAVKIALRESIEKARPLVSEGGSPDADQIALRELIEEVEPLLSEGGNPDVDKIAPREFIEKARSFVSEDWNPQKAKIARDELIEKVEPLIWGVVNHRLRSTRSWQDRGDVFQEIVAVLCNRHKLQGWLDRQDEGTGAAFCHWVAVVAGHVVIDWIGHRTPPVTLPPEVVGSVDEPGAKVGLKEQAAKLREVINATLLEEKLDWRLVFCMSHPASNRPMPTLNDLSAWKRGLSSIAWEKCTTESRAATRTPFPRNW